MIKRIVLVFVILGCFAIHATGAYRSIYPEFNFSYGAKALSLGNAFTAISDDLSAVFTNPAGIARFKQPELYLSYSSSTFRLNHETETKDRGSYKEAYNREYVIDLKQIDFLSVGVPAYFFNTKWTFALSYYRYLPYNFNGSVSSTLTKEDPTAPSRLDSGSVVGSNGIDVIALTASMNLTDYLYFGVTLKQFINSGTVQYNYFSERKDYSQSYDEQVKGQSFIFGLLFAATEEINIGFSYHTKSTQTLTSSYAYKEDIDANNTSSEKEAVLELPAKFSLGISVKLLPELEISYDYSKMLWSKSTVSGYHGSSASLPYPVLDNFTFTQTDITNSNLGLQYAIRIKETLLFLRTGLSTVRQLFSDASSSQGKLRGYSAGIGIALKGGLVLDGAFQYRKATWKELAYYQTTSSSNDTVDAVYKSYRFKIGIRYIFQLKR